MAEDKSKILWKPSSERDGNLVILFPYRAGNVVIRDKDGRIIARGRSTGPSNGFRDTIRFDRPGSSFRNVTIEDDSGRNFDIGNGRQRHENIGTTGDSGDLDGGSQDVGDGVDDVLEDVPGGDDVPTPQLLDPDIVSTPDPISFPVIPAANFNFTDPIDTTRRVGDFNREQSERNFITAVERSRELSREELAAVTEFAKGASAAQLDLLEVENAFNQQQRLQAAEVAIPGVQDLLARQRERAETLSEGRLLETAEDRAIELAARSTAAEGSVIRGFGDDSVAGRRQSDLLSASQRLQVSQIGEGFLNRSIQQATGLLFDQPTKANIAQRIPAQSAIAITQLAPNLQAQENALTTITPGAAQQSIVGQEQFQTNIEQQRNLTQARGDFDAAQFNSNQQFSAILSRANIAAGNVQAQNEAAIQQFNVDEGRKEREEIREILNRAISTFRDNQDRNELFRTLGAIYGAVSNIPQGVRDFINEQVGFELFPPRTRRPQRPSGQPGGGGGADAGDGQGGGEGLPPPRGGDDGLPGEPVPDDGGLPGEPVPEDGGLEPIPEDPDDGFPDRPPGSFPEDDDPDEQGGKFSRKAFRKSLRLAGLTKREVRTVLRQAENQFRFNSGATLAMNLSTDDSLVGVI